MRSTALVLALASSLTLTACGGGGIFAPPVEAQMPLMPAFTGYIYDGGVGGTNTGVIRVGDNDADNTRRGFVRFDLSSIPVGANIVSAELHMTQTGTNSVPYGAGNLGTIHLRHVANGLSFTAADFANGPLSIFSRLFSSTAGVGIRSANVTDWVLDDLNDGRSTMDIRMQFGLPDDGDGVADFAIFEDDPASLDAPMLIVRYDAP